MLSRARHTGSACCTSLKETRRLSGFYNTANYPASLPSDPSRSSCNSSRWQIRAPGRASPQFQPAVQAPGIWIQASLHAASSTHALSLDTMLTGFSVIYGRNHAPRRAFKIVGRATQRSST
jgi:hypothetical protein